MPPTKKKITLYSTSVPIRSAVRNAFEGDLVEVNEITDSLKMARSNKKINEEQQDVIIRLNLPLEVDGVISIAGLTKTVESLAATLALKQNRNDVYVIVLPEAIEYLRNLLDRRGSLTLVGADQAK